MRDDIFYQKLREKMADITVVSPQTIGPLTPVYKRFVPYVKVKPLRALTFGAFVTSFLLYLLVGSLVVRLASILQFGF